MIRYEQGNQLALKDILDVYQASTLGERRPMSQPERMEAMVRNANLVITAWDGPLLVGISRSMSDFVYATYLSDRAVRESHQKQGIGMELIRQTQAVAPQASVILLAAPAAVDYYPRIGFRRHNSAWVLKPGWAVGEPLKE
jgi:GNAT superfamily N-acetyltransferase